MNTRRAASIATLTVVLAISPYARATAASAAQISDPVTDTVQVWTAIADWFETAARQLATTFELKQPLATGNENGVQSASVALAADQQAAPPLASTALPSTTSTIVNQFITKPRVTRPGQTSGSYVTEDQFNAALSILANSLPQLILENTSKPVVSGPGAPLSVEAFAPSQAIDNLSNVTITNANLTASEIPDLSGSYLPLSGGTVNGNLTVNGFFSGGSLSLSAASTSNFTATNATSTNFYAQIASFGSLSLSSPLSVASGGTGWTSIASGYLPFGNGAGALATSSALYWDNVHGRLGIGTTSPTAILTLDSASPTGTVMRVSNSSAGGHAYDWLSTGSGNTGGAGRLDLYDFTAGAPRLSIASNGNVGVGTTSPFAKFSVNGNGYFTGALTAPVQDAGGEVYNVKAFGAKGDGATDDTNAIQAAINAAEAAGGGTVAFPTGQFKAHITISSAKIYLMGAGENATTLVASDGNSDVVNFYNSTSYIQGGISNLSIVYNGTPTAGCGIDIDNVGAITVNNVLIRGTWNGFCINQGTQGAGRIENTDTQNIANDSYYIESTNEVFIDGFTTYQTPPGGTGIQITNGAGIHISNGNTSLESTGLEIDPSSGQKVINVWLDNLDLDASIGTGMSIDCTAGGSASNINGQGVRTGYANDGSYTNGRGIIIAGANCQNIALTGGQEVRNVTEGVLINGGSGISLVNNLVQGNSVAGPGLYSGINIAGGDNIIIANDNIGAYPSDGNPNNQQYGVAIQSTFTGHASIQGDNLVGNFTGAISNLSSSPNIVSVENQGDSGALSVGNFTSFGTASFGSTATSSFNSAGLLSLVSNGLSVGTNQLVVSGGKLGIGTTSPDSGASFDTFSGQAVVHIGDPSTNNSTTKLLVDNRWTGAGGFGLIVEGGLSKAYELTVDGTGNVGIGATTTPGSILSITGVGNFVANSTSTLYNGLSVIGGLSVGNFTSFGTASFGSTATSSFNSAGLLSLVSNGLSVGTNQLVVSGGKLGIGTTSPAQILDIENSVSNNGIKIGNSGGNYGSIYDDGNFHITNSAGTLWIDSANTSNLGLNTQGNGNVLLANGGGSVGIGTTTPWARLSASSTSATPTFAIQQNGGGSAAVILGGNVGIGTANPYSRLSVWGPDTASTTAFLVANSASTTEFAVYDTGNATLAGGLIQNSDQRLKTNIQSLDASSSLSMIDQLNPVTFNWIDPAKGSTPQLGFIAQQVLPIFPNLVSTTSATTLTPDGTLSLNYIDLISPIVSAIQALSSEVTSIENTIAGFADSFTTNQLTFVRGQGVEIDVETANIQTANVQTLCIGSTCVTEAQLQDLLAAAGQAGSSAASSDSASGDSQATATPPVIKINGDNPAIVQVGASYNDLGATITGPQTDLNLGVTTFLNGTLTSNIVIDTSQVATDTIDYVATDQTGLTATSTRTVIIEAASSSPPIQ